jgi:hypothetical protein
MFSAICGYIALVCLPIHIVLQLYRLFFGDLRLSEIRKRIKQSKIN